MEWFSELALFEKVYWSLAILGSIILVALLIMTFIGGEIDADVDVDGDGTIDGGAGFQFFTFKNFIGFITIFGWTGLGGLGAGYSTFTTIIISTICGLIMMLMMSSIFYFMSKLVEDGSMRISSAIGRTGEVYLPIAANNGGLGKVQINIQGSIHEIQAFTNDDKDLKVGTIVRVEKVIDKSILLVTSNL